MSSVLKSLKRFLKRHPNLSSSEFFKFLYLMILGGSGSKLVRKIVTNNLWKPERPVSYKTCVMKTSRAISQE